MRGEERGREAKKGGEGRGGVLGGKRKEGGGDGKTSTWGMDVRRKAMDAVATMLLASNIIRYTVLRHDLQKYVEYFAYRQVSQ